MTLDRLKQDLWRLADEAMEQMVSAVRGENEVALSPRDLRDTLQMAVTLAIKIDEYNRKQKEQPEEETELDLPSQWKAWTEEYEREKAGQ